MHPNVYAAEAHVWTRVARRRLEGAQTREDSADEIDKTADLAQGIEALDRAIRYMDRLRTRIDGVDYPAGVDWAKVREFARHVRDTMAHGDERLATQTFGFLFRIEGDEAVERGQGRGESRGREIRLPLATLRQAIEELDRWAAHERTIT